MTMRRLSFLAAGLACIALLAPSGLSAEPSATPAPHTSVSQAPVSQVAVTSAPGAPLTKADLDSWLDGYMPYALESGDVAGAVVTVVKDGQVVTERGFGYSDMDKKAPVDPKMTLFRPGSTSKLFTWTAVMQQVQLGKIDLDRDVNTYLDFKIPPYHGQPVTMRNIMTHTAGFEEAIGGLMSENGEVPPLDQVVKHWIPKRVFAPGTTPSYSNYGAMLAGYIVQRVSGEPFDGYIQHHIFQPLGMAHSTFSEPLPPNLAPLMSKGYALASGPAKPFELITFTPAGSATVSGDDMTKFAIAHLDPEHNPLLNAATMREMHDTALTILPPLNRMDLGFYEANLNGRRIIAHGGDTQWFHSYLWLLPDDRTGIFFSMNSAGKGAASLNIRESLIGHFMDRYFPAAPAAASTFTPRPEDAAAMAGVYNGSRRSDSGLRRALNFFTEFRVTADAHGGLHVPGFEFTGANGAPRDWVEIAPFVWKDRYGSERLAAQLKDGKVVRFGVDAFSPFTVYDRVPWYQSTAWLKPALMLSVLVLLAVVLSAPFGWIARKYYGADRKLQGSEMILYGVAAALSLGVVAILFSWMTLLTGLRFQVLGAGTYVLEVATVVVLPALCLASAWLLGTSVVACRDFGAMAWRGALLLAAACVLWVALAFNLTHIGVNF